MVVMLLLNPIDMVEKTRAVRGSDYKPAIALSEEKDKLVTQNWRDRKRKK